MTDVEDRAGLSPALRVVIATEVEAVVEEKVRSYKENARLVLYGFGGLIFVLLASGLVTEQSFARWLHDWMFGFETSLSRTLKNQVAISYNNGFWLSTDHPQETIAFYAHDDQTVNAIVEIHHKGTGEQLGVKIMLRGVSTEIKSTSANHDALTVPVSAWLTHDPRIAYDGPKNVHVLVFSVPDDTDTNDQVFVRSLILVNGLEGNP